MHDLRLQTNRRSLRRFSALILLLLLALSYPVLAHSPDTVRQDDPANTNTNEAGRVMTSISSLMPASSDNPQVLRSRVSQQGQIPVIVTLNVPNYQPDAEPGNAQAQIQRSVINQTQGAVLSGLNPGTFTVNSRYRYTPALALTVNASALEGLLMNPNVASVVEDIPESPALASSLQVIEATTPGGSFDMGHRGAGRAVAILDTGVQIDHPMFSDGLGGSRVVYGACFNTATTGIGYVSTSRCPNGLEADTSGPAAAVDCESSDGFGCEHGTHVAGIAAGDNRGHNGNPLYGVAPEADIIALNVFGMFTGSICGSHASCVLTFASDQIEALEYVYDLVQNQGVQVASANMSLGGGDYTAHCDSSQAARKIAIDNLRGVGVATIIAAGNGRQRDGISAPGCISSAISVGATTDSDGVASFSNVADFLDLHAPGQNIVSSTVPNDYSSYNGTSMAAPHVAGAFAALRGVYPTESVSYLKNVLEVTGTPVDDNRTDGTVTGIPRLSIGDAVNAGIDVDFNNDNRVTPTDAVYVINRLNTADISADADNDNDVDFDDLTMVQRFLGDE